MNIIQERLEREFSLLLISTAPSFNYEIRTKSGEVLSIENPSEIPEQGEVESIKEPMVNLSIHVPSDYVGKIIKLCEDKRGVQRDLKSLTKDKVKIVYDFIGYQFTDLVKLEILLNGDKVDALYVLNQVKRSPNGVKVIARETVKTLRRNENN